MGQSMEILRHGNNLQSEPGKMSVWPGSQTEQHKEKYFYQNNEFFKTNEEEKDQTYLGSVGERPVAGDQFLQSAILCASLLALILIIAILVVHRKHSRSLTVNTERRDDARETVIVVSGEESTNTTSTFICDSRDVER